jgi:hypothetical protein
MMLPIDPTDRIVLDTNIIRGLIEGRAGCLNVSRLGASKASHPVSIADGAFGELLSCLQSVPVDFLKRVKPALERLDPVLDHEFPMVMGGSQRLALAGLMPWPKNERGWPPGNRQDEARRCQAFWRLLKRIQGRHSLWKKQIDFLDSKGRKITVTPRAVDDLMRESQDEWQADVVELPAEMNLNKASEKKRIRERREHAAKKNGIDPDTPGLERIDLFNEYVARRHTEFSRRGVDRPKNPSSNKWFDADMLVYNILPAVICTDDMNFIRAVRQPTSEDRYRLMNLEELYQFLESGLMPS